jgi:hypothetical protein
MARRDDGSVFAAVASGKITTSITTPGDVRSPPCLRPSDPDEGPPAKAGSMDAPDRTKRARREASAVDQPHYVIRVKGRLDARWAASFDGMHLTNEDDGTTTIDGPVVDQAALHGLLQKLRDVGIPLISLSQADHH